MPQAEVRHFPGYGIVYLDGNKGGIKVVRTYTQAPKKIFNEDGSHYFSTPPPVIHELFGGGFTYEDGSRVTIREHLENITDIKMRERALRWFDNHGTVSEKATKDIPPLVDPEKRVAPETVYVIRPDNDEIPDEVTEELNKAALQDKDTGKPAPDILSQIMGAVKEIGASVGILTKVQKEQGAQIEQLKKHPPAPRRMAASEAKHSKQSEAMKAKWADPVKRQAMLDARAKKVEAKTDGQDAPETDPQV